MADTVNVVRHYKQSHGTGTSRTLSEYMVGVETPNYVRVGTTNHKIENTAEDAYVYTESLATTDSCFSRSITFGTDRMADLGDMVRINTIPITGANGHDTSGDKLTSFTGVDCVTDRLYTLPVYTNGTTLGDTEAGLVHPEGNGSQDLIKGTTNMLSFKAGNNFYIASTQDKDKIPSSEWFYNANTGRCRNYDAILLTFQNASGIKINEYICTGNLPLLSYKYDSETAAWHYYDGATMLSDDPVGQLTTGNMATRSKYITQIGSEYVHFVIYGIEGLLHIYMAEVSGTWSLVHARGIF